MRKTAVNPAANQEVAEQFMRRVQELQLDRSLFNGKFRLNWKGDREPRWSSTAKGDWQGYIVEYELTAAHWPDAVPCEIYLGTIGARGRDNFADLKSRFIVTRIGRGSKQVTTQYGLHQYVRTGTPGLLPFYELKFNATGLPKIHWERVYRMLEEFGYAVEDSESGKLSKVLWVGDIALADEKADEQLGNLLESLFAVTLIKAYFKGGEYGQRFAFLDDVD